MNNFILDTCIVLCEPIAVPDGYEIFNDNGVPEALTPPTLVNTVVTVGGTTIPFNDIVSVGIICPADAVAQVDLVTPVQFPGTDCCGTTVVYGVTISWKDSCGEPQLEVYKMTLDASNAPDAAHVSALFIASINGRSNVATAATSGNNFTLTAQTPGQGFTTLVTGPQMTVATNTDNVVETGTAAWLQAMGVPSSSIASGADYNTVLIQYRQFSDQGADIERQGMSLSTVAIFVESGGAAETAILSNANTLCPILGGTYSPVNAYYTKFSGTCPCS